MLTVKLAQQARLLLGDAQMQDLTHQTMHTRGDVALVPASIATGQAFVKFT
jgi:hypothetical protein